MIAIAISAAAVAAAGLAAWFVGRAMRADRRARRLAERPLHAETEERFKKTLDL